MKKPGNAERLLKAQADEREAKAALAELKLQIERGEYLPMADVKQRDLARVHIVRRGLLDLGRTLAPRLVGMVEEKDLEIVIKTEARRLLERFAAM